MLHTHLRSKSEAEADGKKAAGAPPAARCVVYFHSAFLLAAAVAA